MSIAAGVYALAELLCGIGFGHFFAIGRAEPDPFIAARPILLFLLILALRRWSGALRWGAIVAGLALALMGQVLLLSQLGGGFDPRSTAVQITLAVILAGLLDALVQMGRRFARWPGGMLAMLAAVALWLGHPLVISQPVVELLLSPAPRALPKLPTLVVVTGLPIVRGEGDIGDLLAGKAAPAQSWRWLERHFRATPIDFVTPQMLDGRGLLLLAQPRALQPQELVAIDDWVRGGGRALVLTDPALHWDSRYPLGDPRAPPPMSLLDPLMTRWGVRLDQGEAGRQTLDLVVAGQSWRVAMDAVGLFVPTGADCRAETGGRMAFCTVGQGTVLLVADADLMADRLWAAEGPDGAARARRIADNGPIIGAWLDSLGGIARDRRADIVRWSARDISWLTALGLALMPGLLGLVAGLFMRFWLRSRPA